MKSFSLIKTNVGLTTNIKIMVDNNYNLYLDSIESAIDLSNSKFKKMQFSKDNYYDELISSFYKGLDAKIAFFVKNDNDNNIMFTTFDKQIDDRYIMGCQDITDNKYYSEDYEFFAPLHISKNSIPNYFVIFRVDGPGLNSVNKDNFRTEILNKFKCVKIVDLSRNTDLGKWLDYNINNNTQFPSSAFEMDFRSSEFSYWNGIDLENGGYTKKSYHFDSTLEYENTFNDIEKFIYDGFQKNKVIYPNIFNFSFLFNDEPATPTSLRKWSLNRYSGFYLEDMILSKSVSTYLPSVLVPGFVIKTGNIITDFYNKPFTEATLKLDRIFIEYLGNFYEVKKVIKDIGGVKTIQWTIISDIDLVGKQALINKNIINIDENNKITYSNGDPFTIENYNTADVWLIKIGDKFHNIQFYEGNYYIYTDYGFSISGNNLSYFINSPDPYYNTTIDMSSGNSWTGDNVILNDKSNIPVSLPIYKCIFSDVKNFDESIVDTEFSKFEYDKDIEVVQTDESKMYLTNLEDKNYPKNKVDFLINSLPVNIPASSHYTANNETFRIINNGNNQELNNLWKKNMEHTKWGFKNSLSANDYPYLLNNSFLAEDFNKVANTYTSIPLISDRNLDYFYTINSSTVSYSNHSLHIEDIQNNSINLSYSFDINRYLDLSFDYYTYFFDRKVYLNNSSVIKNVSKFSHFNSGDKDTPNITLFRGLKIKLSDVDSVKIINNQLQTINLSNNNNFDDYKFTILLSKNNITIETDSSDLNKIYVTASSNQLEWNIIDSWKHEKEYDFNSVVNYMDILYTSLTSSNVIVEPDINPANNENWTYSTTDAIFWKPTTSYSSYVAGSMSGIVYNSEEYYYNNGLSSNTFYNPSITYDVNDIVRYKKDIWISNTSSNTRDPLSRNIWSNSSNFYTYWSKITEDSTPLTSWSVVSLWDSLTIYVSGSTVVYENILYYTNTTTVIGIAPNTTSDWIRMYSLVPNTNYIYGSNIANNNLIYLNNRYYLCTYNTNSTLDNGINIYINKKYKNVLINIYVNDNTLDGLSNQDRHYLYKDLYSNLTAFNFANAINDVYNNYGFVNKLKYIIFDDTASNIYDFDKINSFKNLTTLLTIDGPDEFKSRILSLHKIPVTLQSGQIKAAVSLNNGDVSTKTQINHFNNIHLGNTVERVRIDAQIIPNYSSLQNKIYNNIYRHSGYYEPIFSTIDLFQKGLSCSNSIFDTELTTFGLLKHVITSKINRVGSVLKLKKSTSLKSIYPMLDEFGYTTSNLFIFKSTWDKEYYSECNPTIVSNTINTQKVDTPISFNPISVTPKYLS